MGVPLLSPANPSGVPTVNVPSPFPSNTVPSEKIKSGLPSPLKSAVTTCPVPG